MTMNPASRDQQQKR